MYLRKSRQDDPNETVEEVLAKHETILQDWARRELGREIPEDCIYREIVSGGEGIEEREAIQKVLARIEDPNVAGVLCVDPQRLSRGSLTDCDLLIDAFRYSNTIVATTVMIYDLDNKMGRRFFQDELMRGRDYLEYVKEALFRGRWLSASRGNFVQSRPPYGYNKVKIGRDWVLEPNENADIVRMIFNWYAREYLTPKEIADKLNQMLVAPPLKNPWSREYIGEMLKNKHYDGKVVFGETRTVVVFENGKKVTKRLKQKPEDMVITEGKHPAIVDHELFELAQERTAGRSYLAPKVSGDKQLSNQFAGVLKCSVCGYAMVYHKTSDSFRCKRFCCKAPKTEALTHTVKTALLTDHLPELEAKLKNGDGKSLVLQKQILDKLEKQMAEFKAQEVKQYDLLETGIYTNEVFLERNTALREKITSCSTQLAEAKKSLPKAINYEEKILSLKEAINALEDDTIPLKEKNILIKSVISSIIYYAEKKQPFGQNEFKLRINLNL